MESPVHGFARIESIDRETFVLGLGDVGLLVGLIAVGQREHGVDLLSEPWAAVETMVPFVVGWLAVGLLAGVYSSSVTSSPMRSVRVTTVAWLAAANVGLLLRSSPAFDGGSAWPFTLVITGFGLVVLVTWRVGYALFGTRLRS